MPAPRTCSFVIPGDWRTPTGGYRYDRRIALALRAAGWKIARCTLGASFPWPDAAALADAERQVAALADGTLAVADGLAFGAMPDLVHRHAARLRWVALLHHPLYLETGLDAAARAKLLAQERRALQAARRVIVTSAATARDLAPLAVPAERIAVVEPGTDPAPPARGNGRAAPGAVRLLCVAALVPRKGHSVLLQALAGLREFDWTLNCVGSPHRDPATAAELHRASANLGLAHRVHWHGELDDDALAGHYAAADLFVLASHHEGYGMVIAEALAHGLPVVATTAGALAQTLPPAAGLQVPPGDVAALRAALARLIGDAGLRARCAGGAGAAGSRLPTWTQAAAAFAAVLEAVE